MLLPARTTALVLLITPENGLQEIIQAALPNTVVVRQLADIGEAEPLLKDPDLSHLAVIILLHNPNVRRIVRNYHRLYRSGLGVGIPKIAILSNPEDRRFILGAGLDDYLLLPLLPLEMNARLEVYFHCSQNLFERMAGVVEQLQTGVKPTNLWGENLQMMGLSFNAPSGWVILAKETEIGSKLTLAGGYNLPPLLSASPEAAAEELSVFSDLFQQENFSLFEQRVELQLNWVNRRSANGLTHHLIIPMSSHKRLLGALVLAYPHLPVLSNFAKRSLLAVGRHLGALLYFQQIYEEAQLYATQNAFLVLIARTINARLELNAILSLTLEHAIPLLNANGGDIWLLSQDGQWLDLVSSLASPFARRALTRRRKQQGIIGQVIERNQALRVDNLFKHPYFDSESDSFDTGGAYALLAAPLNHQGKVIGVLNVLRQHKPFTQNDASLLQGITGLVAPAIANAYLMQELREHAEQRQVLYDMSQQLSAGLDLQITLDRVIRWLGRIFDVELISLWLVEDKQNIMKLVAAQGIEMSPEQKFTLPLGKGLVGWAAANNQTILSNSPNDEPRFDGSVLDAFHIIARNAIALPMSYHNHPLGALGLVNKRSGDFDSEDLTLLDTAARMIAIAVGNARLHAQTLALMDERERLHHQVLYAERLATVGRLTASLSHEINNPMQAIQGALNLALEELDSPEDLTTYLQLSLKEAERVIQLLNRMRQIYRPENDKLEQVDINRILHEVIALANKEFRRQKINFSADIDANLPPLLAAANQLNLVFLSILLNLSDAIGVAGGGDLRLRAYVKSTALRVEFSTRLSNIIANSWVDIFKTPSGKETDLSFGLSFGKDIISAHNGVIDYIKQDQKIMCRIELPIR